MRNKQIARQKIKIADDVQEPNFSQNQSNVLTEKNHNTVYLNCTTNRPFSKKCFIASKAFTAKIHKIPMQNFHYDENLFKISQYSTYTKDYAHSKKNSNIQLLKKQIQYLQQQDIDHQQFPKCQTFVNDGRNNYQIKLKQSLQLYCSRAKANNSPRACSKGFIVYPNKAKAAYSQQKFQRKFLKSKQKNKKEKFDNDKQNRAQKIFCKYELIAPYRKYFQANRFRKNKSCTMKVDEIMGRRLTKLSHTTLQTQL